MKKITVLLGFIFSLFVTPSLGQVNKNIVVEHFTNTRCGICASRNPGFFTNLNNHPDVMHLTVHPSRPYNGCLLNRHNTAENDARTNDYGIYGSTPRLVIQGSVVSSSSNYGSATIFDAYEDQTSPFSVQVTTLKSDKDSLTARIVIKTEASHDYTSLNLYVPAVEDTLYYDAPNGEKIHYDVFRKVLLEQTISDPSKTVGDSMVFIVKSEMHTDWDNEQMYAMAIVQEPTSKEIIQAGVSTVIKEEETAGVDHNRLNPDLVSVHPNPFTNEISINFQNIENAVVSIRNMAGQEIQLQKVSNGDALNTSELNTGIYFLEITSDSGSLTKKMVKM